MFSVTVLTALLDRSFQQRTFPFLWVPDMSPASAAATLNLLSSGSPDKVRVTLRLAVYRQSVFLGVKPLEAHDQRLFL
jgi:hypothetical protein